MSVRPLSGVYEPPGVHTAVSVRGVQGKVKPFCNTPEPMFCELTLERLNEVLPPCWESLRFLDVRWKDSDEVARDNPADLR